jgi:hypothetical protein
VSHLSKKKPSPVTPKATTRNSPPSAASSKPSGAWAAWVNEILTEWRNRFSPSDVKNAIAWHDKNFEKELSELMAVAPVYTGPAFSGTVFDLTDSEILKYYTVDRAPWARADTKSFSFEADTFFNTNRNNISLILDLRASGLKSLTTKISELPVFYGGWYEKKSGVTSRRNAVKKSLQGLRSKSAGPDFRFESLSNGFTYYIDLSANVKGVRLDDLPMDSGHADFFKAAGRSTEIIAKPTGPVNYSGITLPSVIFVLKTERDDFMEIDGASKFLGE